LNGTSGWGRIVRLFVLALCLVASACSLAPYQLSTGPQTNDQAVRNAVRAVFAEAKLPGAPEISEIRLAHPVSPGDWLLCLRSSDPTQRLRYAIYFTGFTYVRSQLASIVDRCDEETYLPFVPDLLANGRPNGPPLAIEATAQKRTTAMSAPPSPPPRP
jgi:hypothetical protein